MMVLKNRSKLKLSSLSYIRRLTTSSPRRIEDEGDWFYSSEWWDSADENTVFRGVSDKGNGVVSVVASPSSRPVYSYSLFHTCHLILSSYEYINYKFVTVLVENHK